MSNTSDDARSFWVVGPGRGEIRTEPLPERGEGQVLVRTLYSGISRGTEVLVFNGAVPASEFERMRAPFQAGDFPAPVKYGYINVGHVEQGPSGLQGRVVFCLYPHQTRYVVPTEDVYPLPDDVPPERAVLAANLESAVNGLWDASPRVGDRVAVVGAGALGCLVSWLAARIPGCSVELIDIDPSRAPVAAALGVGFQLPEHATAEADLVFHTSATEEGLSTALRLAGFEAKIIELSWYGERRPAVVLGESFPQSAPESARIASRHDRPCAEGPLDPEAPYGTRSRVARRFRAGRPDHRSKRFRRPADTHANARDDTRPHVVPSDRLQRRLIDKCA